MSTAVSPLAPTDVPDMPRLRASGLPTAAAGIPYKERTDVLLAVRQGHGQSPASSPSENARPPPVDGAAPNSVPASARLVVNSGICQRFTRQERRQSTTLTASIASQSGRLQRPMRCSSLHRRNRRTARRHQVRRRAGDTGDVSRADDWMGAAKAIMTTDTFRRSRPRR